MNPAVILSRLEKLQLDLVPVYNYEVAPKV